MTKTPKTECEHEWHSQRTGGSPSDESSNEWVCHCKKCGDEFYEDRHTMKPKEEIPEWEKAFDKEFMWVEGKDPILGKFRHNNSLFSNLKVYSEVKLFIFSLLEKVEITTRKDETDHWIKMKEQWQKEERAETVNLIKSLTCHTTTHKGIWGNKVGSQMSEFLAESYNKALSDVLSSLTKE